MFSSEIVTTVPVFPMVSFTNVDGKEFVLPRERILHIETYQNGEELDHDKTFVNFTSPNQKSKGALHAVVDMSVSDFRERVMRPAFEGRVSE